MSSVYLFTSNTRSALLWTSLPTVRLNPKKPLRESGIPDSEEAEKKPAFYGPFHIWAVKQASSGQRQHDWTLRFASNLCRSKSAWFSTFSGPFLPLKLESWSLINPAEIWTRWSVKFHGKVQTVSVARPETFKPVSQSGLMWKWFI